MPARIDHPAVREHVRTLYIANGRNLSLAAKTAGIPIDRAEKWKERGKWDADLASRAQNAQILVSENVGLVSKRLEEDLQQKKTGAFSHMATYAERAARQAATHKEPLRISRNARDVEAIRASLWPHENTQSVLQVQVLNQVNVTRTSESSNDVSP